MIPDALLAKLVCLECRGGKLDASQSGESLCCVACGARYPVIDGVPFLFRLEDLPVFVEEDRERRARSQVVRHQPSWSTRHWDEYGFGDLLPPCTDGDALLAFGCGDGADRSLAESRGFQVTSFDVCRSAGTDLLCDGHDLPFEDESFDVVLSSQVLEHLRAPWVAVAQMARVLRSEGVVVGSAAFLKPYHRSYFHITYRGIIHLLALHGLEVDVVKGAQSPTYALYGTLLPLGKRSISRAVYGVFDRLVSGLRARLWSLRSGLSPDEPVDRFDAERLLSFREFEKLRFAPAVVFRARKVVGS